MYYHILGHSKAALTLWRAEGVGGGLKVQKDYTQFLRHLKLEKEHC